MSVSDFFFGIFDYLSNCFGFIFGSLFSIYPIKVAFIAVFGASLYMLIFRFLKG